MQCPRCQHIQNNDIACESCGIYFEKWRQREQEISQIKTTIHPATQPSNTLRTFGLGVLATSLILFFAQTCGTEENDTTQLSSQNSTQSEKPPVNPDSVQKPLKASPQNAPSQTQSIAEYRDQLQNLRNQQNQLQRELENTRRNYGGRNWSTHDDAQAHADQMKRQEREQELSQQIDALNSQINFLVSRPTYAP